jgi:hypothetical protein
LASSVTVLVIVEWVDTSCNRFFASAPAGTRTQHTNSALPISRAATLGMICSSSWDSVNIAFSFLADHRHLLRWPPGGDHKGKQNLILVLDEQQQ